MKCVALQKSGPMCKLKENSVASQAFGGIKFSLSQTFQKLSRRYEENVFFLSLIITFNMITIILLAFLKFINHYITVEYCLETYSSTLAKTRFL